MKNQSSMHRYQEWLNQELKKESPQKQNSFEKLARKLKEQFVNLEVMLSPENLTCDGALTSTQSFAKKIDLLKMWKALENRVDFKVTRDQVVTFMYKTAV